MAKRNEDGRLNIVIVSEETDFNKAATAVALPIITELNISYHHYHHHHHQILLLLVEHRSSMKSFQAMRSSAIPLTSFHDLLVLISFSIVLRHVLFSLPRLLYPWGFQSNAVFSIAPVSLRNVCPIQFHFFFFLSDYLLASDGWFSKVLRSQSYRYTLYSLFVHDLIGT